MILLIAGLILTLLGGAMLIYLTIGTIQMRKENRSQPEQVAENENTDDQITAQTITVKSEVNMDEEPVFSTIKIGNAQDIGARNEQQDAFGISNIQSDVVSERGLLAVVADGMGGMSNGSQYSRLAVQAALQSFGTEPPEKDDESTLLRIIKRVTDTIESAGLQDGGSTFVAALVHDKMLHFISIGDSRIYLVRNGGLIQLNREHVYGRELDDMVANGLMNADEAANDSQRAALTSYIGIPTEMKVDRNIRAIPLYSGDKIVLMSDGVYGFIDEEEMKHLLMQEPMEAAESIRSVILSRKYERQDNLTIVILEIDG